MEPSIAPWVHHIITYYTKTENTVMTYIYFSAPLPYDMAYTYTDSKLTGATLYCLVVAGTYNLGIHILYCYFRAYLLISVAIHVVVVVLSFN